MDFELMINNRKMNRRGFIKAASIASLAMALPEKIFGFERGAATAGSQASQVGADRGVLSLPGAQTTGSSRGIMLRFAPYQLSLRHSFNLASGSRTTTPDVQVEAVYDGIVGYGEASMPPYLGESVDSVMRFLSKVDLSGFSNPIRLEEVLEYVDAVAPDNNAAKAAVDIALHDLVGKLVGRSWHELWGLSPENAPETSYTIGIDSEEMVRLKMTEADPYNILKVKMGLDRDRETIEIIRSLTDRPICVDVNQGWHSKELALEMCHWLADRNCLFVEQPMPKEQIDDIAWLRERSPLPIIADEAVKRLADLPACLGAYDGINIKLMKSTGLREAHKMATTAKALGLKVMIGCMTETSCGISAAAQLSPLVDWADLDGNLLISNDRFEGATIQNGRVALPASPGIGATLFL